MGTYYVYLNEIDIYYFTCLLAILYLALLLVMAAWFAFRKEKKSRPMMECAECGPGASNFLVPSLYDGSKKICPDCTDKEWDNRPQSA